MNFTVGGAGSGGSLCRRVGGLVAIAVDVLVGGLLTSVVTHSSVSGGCGGYCHHRASSGTGCC